MTYKLNMSIEIQLSWFFANKQIVSTKFVIGFDIIEARYSNKKHDDQKDGDE